MERIQIEKLRISQTERDSKLERIEKKFSGVSSYLLGDITFPDDNELQLLLALYAEIYFENEFAKIFDTIEIEYSNRLTQSAGKAYISVNHAIIRISSMMLFETFDKLDRDIYVNGIVCNSRLSALMRILEHEIVHILEFIFFGKTSCKKKRFMKLANNLFGHTESTHRLFSMYEIAKQTMNISPGSEVEFNFKGKALIGIVSRITKRATVFVPDKKGAYVNNSHKRFRKYLVSLDRLRAIEA